jgi:hypothetical protein
MPRAQKEGYFLDYFEVGTLLTEIIYNGTKTRHRPRRKAIGIAVIASQTESAISHFQLIASSEI